MSEQIPVALGERSYTIHVGSGILDGAGGLVAPFARGIVPVVTDAHVAPLHFDRLAASFGSAGLDALPIVLDPGEDTKSFRALEGLVAQLLDNGVERGGLIVALGGGVIGDVTGFAAGILKRGIAYAQIPTTLLAQVDSSVGGKTAVNTRQGKNLVGLFHQPAIVIADVSVLATLPRRELLAGYAEVAKYGVLGDAAFFQWLGDHARDALAGEADRLMHMVAHACRMKAAIVARDERESGERALLNLGHTFAHALEAAVGYSDRLLHGEAVAIGMVLALRLSVQLGLAPQSDVERLRTHLRSVSLPVDISDIPGERPDAELLVSHMMHDKKAKDGRLMLVLVRGLGHAFTTGDVPIDAVRAVLQ
jgi:3-dehydroquinate synthase